MKELLFFVHPLINGWLWIARALIDQEATLSREAPSSSLGTSSLPKMATTTTSRTATTASSNSDLSAGKSSESRQEDEEEEEEGDLGEEG